MTYKIIGCPSRYIQGVGIIENLYELVEKNGSHFLILADIIVTDLLKERVEKSFAKGNKKITWVLFNGESSPEEVARVEAIYRGNGCDAVIGAGGGKALDTAKVVANNSEGYLIIIPTIASTDAPCSSLAVMYRDGELPTDVLLPRNPDMVLVDLEVIANAPSRLLVAGMGDAFATYYEARACRSSNATNMFSGLGTNSAYELAKLSNTILMEDGLKAKIAVENKAVTKSLENIVETNIYLSGVGFENNGCAIAHGIYNGFSTLSRKHTFLHGECVAFGTLVQLVLENENMESIKKIQDFFFELALPLTLDDLGLGDLTEQELEAATLATYNNQITHNMPFDVTAKGIKDAIIATDAMGKIIKSKMA